MSDAELKTGATLSPQEKAAQRDRNKRTAQLRKLKRLVGGHDDIPLDGPFPERNRYWERVKREYFDNRFIVISVDKQGCLLYDFINLIEILSIWAGRVETEDLNEQLEGGRATQHGWDKNKGKFVRRRTYAPRHLPLNLNGKIYYEQETL